MSVTSVNDVRVLVQAASGLDDAALQAVIERVEREIEAMIGGAYVDEATAIRVRLRGGGQLLALPRRILSVTAVREYGSPLDEGTSVGADGYTVWAEEGVLERYDGNWGARVDVDFVPQDDRSAWKQAVIDLVRLDVERTALAGEQVGMGDYGYTAPRNWEAERQNVLRRLRFLGVGG